VNSLRALKPPLIPTHIWTDTSTDLIVGLPSASNKLVIMVVVDCLSNYDHFLVLSQPFTLSSLSQDFMNQILKLHGMSTSIVLDQDPTFTITFW
jgi:hypothetical protein